MKILHISDTHCTHHQLMMSDQFISYLSEADIIVHSGDGSDSIDLGQNYDEMEDFVQWFKELPIEHKIYVPGNHDMSLGEGMFNRSKFKEAGIHLLIDDEVVINGVKFYGTPYVSKHSNSLDWTYTKPLGNKLHRHYENIPEDTDVLITHSPPLGILDVSDIRDCKNLFDLCGNKVLRNVVYKLPIKAHLFGHIHNSKGQYYQNYGVMTVHNKIYSNATCSIDRDWGICHHYGNLIEI